jgi:sialate O-acetylesterase
MAKDGELKGFTIAGADGTFAAAKATIEGDKVVLSSPSVAAPVAVRYGWANTPDVNLFNKEGLPATPFRTDVK